MACFYLIAAVRLLIYRTVAEYSCTVLSQLPWFLTSCLTQGQQKKPNMLPKQSLEVPCLQLPHANNCPPEHCWNLLFFSPLFSSVKPFHYPSCLCLCQLEDGGWLPCCGKLWINSLFALLWVVCTDFQERECSILPPSFFFKKKLTDYSNAGIFSGGEFCPSPTSPTRDVWLCLQTIWVVTVVERLPASRR